MREIIEKRQRLRVEDMSTKKHEHEGEAFAPPGSNIMAMGVHQ